jgi:hypothetical protein
MNETRSGLISDFEDKQQLKKNLITLFSNAQITNDQNAVKGYSRRKLTEKLASLLN